MQTQSAEAKPKTRIVACKICCEVCNLSQHYHGKDHTRCIHCLTPLDLSKLKPKYEYEPDFLDQLPLRCFRGYRFSLAMPRITESPGLLR